jgi:hypothetical protein
VSAAALGIGGRGRRGGLRRTGPFQEGSQNHYCGEAVTECSLHNHVFGLLLAENILRCANGINGGSHNADIKIEQNGYGQFDTIPRFEIHE